MKEVHKEEVKKGAPFAALSYIFFICIFVLIYKKDNAFARFHAKQALVIFIGEMIFWVLGMVIPVIGFIFSFFGSLIFLVCSVIGIFASLMGLKIKFPVIAQIAEEMVI